MGENLALSVSVSWELCAYAAFQVANMLSSALPETRRVISPS